MAETRFLDANGERLAYRETNLQAAPEHRAAPEHQAVLVWLCGFRSDMAGDKASTMAAWAQANNRAFLRMDYRGHGQSSGDFKDGAISLWRDDALAVINARAGSRPITLIGSSMGGWIALLLARALGSRLRAMVLIAAAPDFTERILWPALPEAVQAKVMEQGSVELPPRDEGDDPMLVTRKLIEDGRKHLVMDDLSAVRVPTRLLHGMEDKAVPWREAAALAEALPHDDTTLTLIPKGDHRLSRLQDLRRMEATIGVLD